MRRAAAGLPENATSIEVESTILALSSGIFDSLPAARPGPSRSWRRLFFRERAPRQALERIDMRINDRVSDPFNRPQLPPRCGAAAVFGSEVAYSSKPRLKLSGNCTLLARARSITSVATCRSCA